MSISLQELWRTARGGGGCSAKRRVPREVARGWKAVLVFILLSEKRMAVFIPGNLLDYNAISFQMSQIAERAYYVTQTILQYILLNAFRSQNMNTFWAKGLDVKSIREYAKRCITLSNIFTLVLEIIKNLKKRNTSSCWLRYHKCSANYIVFRKSFNQIKCNNK